VYHRVTHEGGEERIRGRVMESLVHSLDPGTEGGRRPAGVPGGEAVEVAVGSKRRRVTVAYKIRVVETVASLRSEGHGSIGAFLRKEGLYYSTVRKWTEQYERGDLARRQEESKASTRSLQAENQRLRRKLEQVERKLKKTEAIVEIQKKLSAILGLDLAAKNGNGAEH
jgi:transposase